MSVKEDRILAEFLQKFAMLSLKLCIIHDWSGRWASFIFLASCCLGLDRPSAAFDRAEDLQVLYG